MLRPLLIIAMGLASAAFSLKHEAVQTINFQIEATGTYKFPMCGCDQENCYAPAYQNPMDAYPDRCGNCGGCTPANVKAAVTANQYCHNCTFCITPPKQPVTVSTEAFDKINACLKCGAVGYGFKPCLGQTLDSYYCCHT